MKRSTTRGHSMRQRRRSTRSASSAAGHRTGSGCAALPVLAALVLGAMSAACSEPLVFADWTVPVPEGTRVVEYADATDEDRTGNRIELEEDLVIGPRAGDDNYTLFRPRPMVADSRGNMYVLDGGNSRIQMFDPAGEYVRTLGGQGSGPGEFREPPGGFTQVRMTVADDHVVAYDGAQSRLSVWGPDGTHLGDHAISDARIIDFLAGLDDGSVIATKTERTDDGSLRTAQQIAVDGEPGTTYLGLPRAGNFMIGRIGLSNPTGEILFAASRGGAVYASAGIEYQVLAFAPDGSPRWALRAAHERAPITDDDRTRIVEMLRSNFPDLDPSGTDWPSRAGSIGRLEVDGHGHLYVYEFAAPFGGPSDSLAVDVYDPDGTRLFSGTIPSLRWTDAVGDYVYGIRTNEQTEEDEPVRFRLVEPF